METIARVFFAIYQKYAFLGIFTSDKFPYHLIMENGVGDQLSYQ